MSGASAGLPLAGRGVVITRPREQAAGLAGRVRAAGGEPIVFPALEILDAADLRPLNALIDRLDQYDIAIFISPTAVAKAMNLVRARRELPPGLRVAAIGRGSARELRRFGVADVLVPEGRFDSEGLLALPALADVADRRVVVFRGDGGRELLGDTLRARGAQVEYAECYRRARPAGDAQALLRRWARDEIHAVVVMSGEALRNLYEMLGRLGQQWLRRTVLFVPHERIARAASELGVVRAIVAEAGDDGMVAAMVRHFADPGVPAEPGEDPAG